MNIFVTVLFVASLVFGCSLSFGAWFTFLVVPPDEYPPERIRHLLIIAICASLLATVGGAGLIHTQQIQNNTNTPAPTPIYLTLPNPITQLTPPNSQTNPQ